MAKTTKAFLENARLTEIANQRDQVTPAAPRPSTPVEINTVPADIAQAPDTGPGESPNQPSDLTQ